MDRSNSWSGGRRRASDSVVRPCLDEGGTDECTHAARKLKRAQILLAADAGASDEEIARSVGVGGSTVYRTKRRFVLGNLEAALHEKLRPGAARKLSGKEEALLVAAACSNPPEGRALWNLEAFDG
jgi:transposase